MIDKRVRGVNLGGWLVLERYIKPSLFTIPECFDEKSDHYSKIACKVGPSDPYPQDQWTLTAAFEDKNDARDYLREHWETFVQEEDIMMIKDAGLTHVRIPVGHWIMGDIEEDEPYVDGEWGDFVRVVKLCGKHGVQVWVDLHTAPGSQNGFDNSGKTLPTPTGVGWSGNPENVDRTVKVVRDIAQGIKEEGLRDIVTGFGVLNEPFKGQNEAQVKDFDDRAFRAVRAVLGEDTTVYIADMFEAERFNGFWDDEEHSNTVLDSHYYHVFAETPRGFSPRQHIAYICEKNSRDVKACCWEGGKGEAGGGDGEVSKGLRRMIGEWSVSYDTLVCTKLDDVMESYRKGGEVLEYDRVIGEDRRKFLRNFAKAQMVAWESEDSGVSVGWFYWNFKTEGGAFAEWDYLRGVKQGWIPTLKSDESALKAFGTCESIIFKTDDSYEIVNEFPPPDTVAPDWQAVAADDDVVVSHGVSLLAGRNKGPKGLGDGKLEAGFVGLALLLGLGMLIARKCCTSYNSKVGKKGYEPISSV